MAPRLPHDDRHRFEMARRKGERAARVPLGYDPSMVTPVLRRLYARREVEKRAKEAAERTELRAVRARETNFKGERRR